MRAEVIIASRGELPDNLSRTVGNVLETKAAEDGVCVVFDGPQTQAYSLPDDVRVETPFSRPRGPGQARHHGITTSEARNVVLIDGHMEFPDGWLDAICAHLAKPKYANHVTCCHMQSVDHQWQTVEGQVYRGAFVAYKSREEGDQFWSLPAKWRKTGVDHGPIGACMGACYGFRRSWYGKVGAPLGLLEAWGCDEELLSLSAWFSGGCVWLLPVEVRHMYAAPHIRPGGLGAVEIAQIWANRLTMLGVLPIPAANRKELEAWLTQTGVDWGLVRQLCKAREGDAAVTAQCLIERQKRTWDEMWTAGVIRELTEDEQAATLKRGLLKADAARTEPWVTPRIELPAERRKPQIVVRRQEQCPMCDTLNPYRQQEGFRASGAFDHAHARCYRCGHKVQIRRF